jgi:hypothetical protein
MTRKQLAEALKRRFGVRYSINGANIFVRGDVDLVKLFDWLSTFFAGRVSIRMSTVNPHFRACFYSTPFWLSLFVEVMKTKHQIWRSVKALAERENCRVFQSQGSIPFGFEPPGAYGCAYFKTIEELSQRVLEIRKARIELHLLTYPGGCGIRDCDICTNGRCD